MVSPNVGDTTVPMITVLSRSVGIVISFAKLIHASRSSSVCEQVIINYPGAIETSVDGINNHHDLAGSWADTELAVHGCLYSHVSFSNIDYPGATGGTITTGINKNNDLLKRMPTSPTTSMALRSARAISPDRLSSRSPDSAHRDQRSR